MLRHTIFSVLPVLLCGGIAHADNSPLSTPQHPRYTFSWPLDDSLPQPRGGATQGAEVTLDMQPSDAWKSLQQSRLSAKERDRRAILAMAGTYRVTFDFLEVVPFIRQKQPPAPYQSWATEKIYVDRDTGSFIALVHILEMRVAQDDGSLSEPMVTKHWRQEWEYEPAHIVEYKGNNRWTRRAIAAADSEGAWSQTVYQVDESPRYASVGRWRHNGSFSSWLSDDTWRPLPRREWSVRDDYDVLIGTNRHTVDPTGWTQEENNLKAVLVEQRKVDPQRPFLAREYGVARYDRITGRFAAADRYYTATKKFWDRVLARWQGIFRTQNTVDLREPVDQSGLFVPLFEHADRILEQGPPANAGNQAVIDKALADMGVVLQKH